MCNVLDKYLCTPVNIGGIGTLLYTVWTIDHVCRETTIYGHLPITYVIKKNKIKPVLTYNDERIRNAKIKFDMFLIYQYF